MNNNDLCPGDIVTVNCLIGLHSITRSVNDLSGKPDVMINPNDLCLVIASKVKPDDPWDIVTVMRLGIVGNLVSFLFKKLT